jgi:lipopolysaccharide export system protein LptA
MRWQKIARAVIALVGIGCAVAVYVLTRTPATSPQRPMTEPIDPAATMQSGSGIEFRTRDGEKIAELNFRDRKVFPDRLVLSGVVYTLKKDGTEIRADQAETKGKTDKPDGRPAEFTLTGNVSIKTGEGAVVKGASALHNESTGATSFPGPIEFSRGRMAGTGLGGTYESDLGIFRVLADAKMHMQPDPAAAQGQSGAIEATAATLTFTRANKALLFETNAHITRDKDTMTADRATMYLSDDEQQFRVIELRGHSHVAPAPGQPSDTPDMQADDIDLGFYPGTQVLQQGILNGKAHMVLTSEAGQRSIEAPRITMGTAPDGKTLTRLDGGPGVTVRTPATKDAPARTITATTLSANGDDKNGLTSAVFERNVRFEETTPAAGGRPPGTRVGTSQSLTTKIKGGFDSIDEAQFVNDVTFRDGDVTGDADLGSYFATKGELELRPRAQGGRKLPHVTDGTMTVDAAEFVRINLTTHNVQARRDVKTSSRGRPGGGPARQTPTLFNDQDPVYGFGNDFSYDRAASLAKYLGSPATPAHLKQGDTEVYALAIDVNDDSQDLHAVGMVDSTLLVDEAPAPGAAAAAKPKTSKYNVKSNKLDYVDATRIATYEGTDTALASLKSADGQTEARTLIFTLAKDSRRLERLEARGKVHAQLPTGREAVGDLLVYEAASDQYTLTGAPLTLRAKEDASPGCTISIGRYAIFARGTGEVRFPAEKNPGSSQTRKPTNPAECTAPIK